MMPSQYNASITITQPRILVVEGKDEENFFKALTKHLNQLNFQILDIGGKTQFKNRLKALVQTPGFSQVTSLGIVGDADLSPTSSFQSICSALRNAKLSIPSAPWRIQRGSPKVAVMLMPDGRSRGMLEDLCLRSVISQPATNCVNEYFICLSNIGIIPRNSLLGSKAKVQTFLASKPKTGIPLGIAALKGYWPWSDNAFTQVKQIIRRL